MNAESPSQDPDLLDGWKSIADYLGKSVRTAQRWRAEFGLPVHRPGNQDGESVFAFRSEIDAWRRARRSDEPGMSGDPPNGSGENGAARPPSAPPAHQPAAAPHRPWRRWATGVLALSVMAATGWFVWQEWQREASYWTVRNGTLVVYDADRGAFWQKTFSRPLLDDNYFGHADPRRLGGPTQGTAPRPSPLAHAAIVDLDSDGRNEVLLVLSYANELVKDTMVCYDSRGYERWRYTPSDTAVFGQERLGAPNIGGIAIRERPSGDIGLFVVSQHPSEFPSLVAWLDPTGRVRARYWNAGHVGAVEVLTLAGREWIMVGGPHNESLGASLAVFEASRLGGSAPARVDKYRCNECPTGEPDYFFVFPRTPVSTPAGFPSVSAIHDSRQDAFHADVTHELRTLRGMAAPEPASAAYRFDAAFRIRDADVNGIYYGVEALLVDEGRLTAATARTDKTPLWPVHRWHAGVWETIAGPER